MSLLFIVTAVLYGLAALAYLVHLGRGIGRFERVMHAVLGAAVLAHVVFLVGDQRAGGAGLFDDIHGTLSVLALGMAIAFLVATLRYRIAVVGAFVTPLTLLFFLVAGITHDVAPVTRELRTALVPFHVGVTVLGLAAFAVGFAASLAYVVQERKLRRKDLTGVFRRLPPLDVLDTVAFRSLAVGFPLYTAGVVTGVVFVARGVTNVLLGPAQFVGLVTWIVFASVIGLRVMAGWQGRRAALGTMLGFGCAVIVLAIYASQPGAS